MFKNKFFNINKAIPSWIRPSAMHNKDAFASVSISGNTNGKMPWLQIDSIEGYTNRETGRSVIRETMVTLNEKQMIELRDLINEVLENKVTE